MATQEEVKAALDFYSDIGNGADDIYPYYHIRSLAEEVVRLNNQINNLLKIPKAKLADDIEMLRVNVSRIADDYIPDSHKDTLLAHQKMRDALNQLQAGRLSQL